MNKTIITHRFKVGDIVFVKYDKRATEGKISSINPIIDEKKSVIFYRVCGLKYRDSQIYLTKEDVKI